MTISVGIAAWDPAAGARPDDLLAEADRALYESKANGRNRVTAAGLVAVDALPRRLIRSLIPGAAGRRPLAMVALPGSVGSEAFLATSAAWSRGRRCPCVCWWCERGSGIMSGWRWASTRHCRMSFTDTLKRTIVAIADAALSAFAHDAHVLDDGHDYQGLDAIRDWVALGIDTVHVHAALFSTPVRRHRISGLYATGSKATFPVG